MGNNFYVQDMSEKEKIKKLGLELARLKAESKRYKEQDSLYKSIFDEAADSIIVCDLEAKILEVNKRFSMMTGISKEDYIGVSLSNIFDEKDASRRHLRIDLLKSGIALNLRRNIKTKGSCVPFEINTIKGVNDTIILHLRDIRERIISERALKQSAEIVENIHLGLLITSIVNGGNIKIGMANNSAARIFSTDIKRLVRSTIKDVFSGSDALTIVKTAKKVQEDQQPVEIECFYYDNESKTSKILALKIFFLSEKNQGILIENITEKKEKEKLVRQAEEKYKIFFMNSQVGLFRTKIDGERFTEANDRTAKIFGYRNREHFLIAKRSVWSFYVDQADRKKMLEILTRDGEVKNFEVRMKRHNKPIWVRYSGKYNHEFQWFDGVIDDITHEKNSQIELVESEEKFRKIFDGSMDGIVILDLQDLRIKNANKRLLQMIKLKKAEAIGNSIFQYLPEEFHSLAKKRIYQLSRNRQTAPAEMGLTNNKDISIPVEVNSRIITYEDDKCVLTNMRDVSERVEFKQKLMETIIETEERERKRLANDLHDDIGPLLSTLKMYISSFIRLNDENKKQEFINKIRELITDTTANIRRVSNALSPHVLDEFGLYAAVLTIVDRIHKLINVKLESNIEEKRFHHNVEIVYFRIINELINNTLKHSGAEKLEIRLKYTGNILKLDFSDDGKGFDVQREMDDVNIGKGILNILNRAKSINGNPEFVKNMTGTRFILTTKTSLKNVKR